jgi:hypothetical protein
VEQWEGEDGNHSAQKNNLIKDSEANEKNGYPVPDPNITKINDSKEPRDALNNNLKQEILQVITENFLEKIQHMTKQNVQDALKKFQNTKNKE